MGRIGGDFKNPIRHTFGNKGTSLHGEAIKYIADNKINVCMSSLCRNLIIGSMVVADDQQWSLK